MIDDCSGHEKLLSQSELQFASMQEVDWLVSDPMTVA